MHCPRAANQLSWAIIQNPLSVFLIAVCLWVAYLIQNIYLFMGVSTALLVIHCVIYSLINHFLKLVNEWNNICFIEIESLRTKFSIPVSHTRVPKLIRTFLDEFRTLMKPRSRRKSEREYIDKLQSYEKKYRGKLFDIAVCKCMPECGKCRKLKWFQKRNESVW